MARSGYSKGADANRFGSAEFMNNEEKEKYFGKASGIHVGGNWYYDGQGHGMIVGGSRAGKGTGILMQNLLTPSYKGSIIVIDPKGEYAAISASIRKFNDQQVHIIDPWGLQQNPKVEHGIEPSQYNPLDVLNPDSVDLPDDCDYLAELILPFNAAEKDTHFSDKARQMISAFLLQMVSFLPEEEITLSKLRSLFRQDRAELERWLKSMINNEQDEHHSQVIQENGKELFDFLINGDREAASVLSTAQRATDIFKSKAIRDNTRTSDLDLSRVAHMHQTIYICIPPERLVTHFAWLRLMVGNIITSVQRNPGHPVLMVLEEFHTLGYMRQIEQSMALMAGFNLQLLPVLQDLSQLKAHYKDSWETFIANTAFQCFLGIEDVFTAEYVSRKLGDKTEHFSSPVQGENTQFWQRKLRTPDEVMNEDAVIVFNNLGRPFRTLKTPYYRKKSLRNKYQRNPYLDIPQTFDEQWADAMHRAKELQEGEFMDFPEYGFRVVKTNEEFEEADIPPPAPPEKASINLSKIFNWGLIFFYIYAVVEVALVTYMDIVDRYAEPLFLSSSYDRDPIQLNFVRALALFILVMPVVWIVRKRRKKKRKPHQQKKPISISLNTSKKWTNQAWRAAFIFFAIGIVVTIISGESWEAALATYYFFYLILIVPACVKYARNGPYKRGE
ncbi:MAG: hypothetical protein Roseis2KO_53760 [Roseivirga sp.]